jgi:hypothetical protein
MHGQRFIPLGERGKPDHVGEHDRGQAPLAFDLTGSHHLETSKIPHLNDRVAFTRQEWA